MIPRFSRLAALVSISILALAVLLLVPPGPEAHAVGTTFTVNDAGDTGTGDCITPGTCTLRDAINAANANAGADTILFDSSAVSLITPSSALPAIGASDGITIDGGTAGVSLDNTTFGVADNGLFFKTTPGFLAHNITVRRIELIGFTLGIYICGGYTGSDCLYDVSNVLVEDVSVHGNSKDGVFVDGTNLQDVTISGVDAANNVEHGVFVSSSVNQTGTSISGGTFASNDTAIYVLAEHNATGLTIADNHVTSSGSLAGIAIQAKEALNHTSITGNSVSETQFGISLNTWQDSADVTISENVVSDVVLVGLNINAIGGTLSFAAVNNDVSHNGDYGVDIYADPGAQVVGAVRDNVVTWNGKDGIIVGQNTHTTISRNTTHTNGRLGINLVAPGDPVSGVTPNDVGDGDTGPNNLLNFPVITGDTPQAVTGTACAHCTVELFFSDQDASGYGEGVNFLAKGTTNGSGQFSVPICDSQLVSSIPVTATATDAQGNTSEFSLTYSLTADAAPCPTPTPSSTPTASPTPTATPTHTPTPTPASSGSPTAELTQGNVDCANGVTSVDALKELRYVAQLSVSQTEPCPDIGTAVASFWGDVDCSGTVTSVDALKILRYVALLSVSQTEPCPDIGAPDN